MNRVLSVYHNRRWDNGFLTLRRAIDEGHLGKIYLYEARFERFRPTTRSERWREQPHGGSGVLFDLGSHLIDQALSLFGKPQGVYCDLAAQRPGSVVDDYFHVLMDYGDLRVVLASGCVVGVPGPVLSVHGDKGTFIKRSLDPQEDALKEGLSPDAVVSWGLDGDEAQLFVSSETGVATPLPYPTIPGSYHQFYEGVYSAIVEGAAPPVSGDDGVAVIEIVEACLCSNKERRWVSLS
jgi:scyllo-inositol 2-dehydrogenase (NADP+)